MCWPSRTRSLTSAFLLNPGDVELVLGTTCRPLVRQKVFETENRHRHSIHLAVDPVPPGLVERNCIDGRHHVDAVRFFSQPEHQSGTREIRYGDVVLIQRSSEPCESVPHALRVLWGRSNEKIQV